MEPLRLGDPLTIGGYGILARLGSGGMGAVYLGLAPDGGHVAVKVIRADFDGPEALARFRHEVETVGALRSGYAAALRGSDLTTQPIWLATEYIPGPTAAAAVAACGPLLPGVLRRLAAGLAAALAEVHGQGILHRDLKPHNVILSPAGPRLIDFGIARTLDQTVLTRTGGFIGTPGYLAPEVVQGGRATAAADMFALGAVLAQAATGRPPFGVGDPHAVLFRSVEKPADVEGVSEDVARLIAWCTAKDPAARPTAPQLAAALAGMAETADDIAEFERFHAGLGAITETPPRDVPTATAVGLRPAEISGTRGTAARRRRPIMAIAVGGVAVATVVALAVRFGPGGTGSHGAEGSTGTNGARSSSTSGPSASGGSSAALAAAAKTSAEGTPAAATGSPAAFLRDRPGNVGVTTQTTFNPATLQCENSPPVEEKIPDAYGFMRALPIDPVTEGSPVTIGFRGKGTPIPPDYYVAAVVVPPPGVSGNAITYTWVDAAKPLSNDWVNVNYPDSFKSAHADPGAGDLPASTQYAGNWVVLYFHVHPDGEAYYIDCGGFVVS